MSTKEMVSPAVVMLVTATLECALPMMPSVRRLLVCTVAIIDNVFVYSYAQLLLLFL